MSRGARARGRRRDPRGPKPALVEIREGLVDGLVGLPRRVVSALLEEVVWLVVAVLPLWGLSLLAWWVSPWALVALVVGVVGWTAWSLLHAGTSGWALAGVVSGLALLQLAPVLLVMAL